MLLHHLSWPHFELARAFFAESLSWVSSAANLTNGANLTMCFAQILASSSG
jgi:hypothetical protein